MRQGHFKGQYIEYNDAQPIYFSKHNRQFFPRKHSKVFWQDFVWYKSKSQIWCSSTSRRVSLSAPCAHWIGLFHISFFLQVETEICICSFRGRRTRSRAWFGLAVCETCLSAWHASAQLSFSSILCLNALNSFECLNWHGLKTHTQI